MSLPYQRPHQIGDLVHVKNGFDKHDNHEVRDEFDVIIKLRPIIAKLVSINGIAATQHFDFGINDYPTIATKDAEMDGMDCSWESLEN